MLQRLGHRADCASNAADGARLTRVREYDFVLLDMKMPVRNGMWFMEHASLPPTTRVLVMSGFAAPNVVEQMLAMGAHDYLVKPFTSDDLSRALDANSLSRLHVGGPTRTETGISGPLVQRTGSAMVCVRLYGGQLSPGNQA